MISDEEAEELREMLLEQLNKLPEEQQEQAEILKNQIKSMSKEQLEQFVRAQSQNQGNSCIFCQIIEGKLETVKIYEDKDIIAILDIYPASLGHMIIMPKQHFETLEEIPDALLNKLFLFIKEIMPTFLKVTGAKATNIFIAQGELAGQFVKHFAINLIPRYENDNIGFGWKKTKVSKEELEKVAEKIRKEAEHKIREKIEAEKEKEAKKKIEKEATEAEKIMKHIKRRMP